MRRLQLDFQRRPRLAPWPGVLLLLLALLLAQQMLGQYLGQNAEQAMLEGALEYHQVPRPSAAASPKTPDSPQLRREIQRANEVVEQISLPWDLLLATMEQAAGPDIALLAIQPNVQKASIKLSGEARNMDVLLAYIRRLEKQRGLQQAHLQSHQVQIEDPDKPIHFVVVANWRTEG